MPHTFLAQNDDGALSCPLCGDDYVHLDEVYMAGRPDGEDGPFKGIHVDNLGHVEQDNHLNFSAHVGGRRHTIVICGWCEGCNGTFEVELQQHKGRTLLAIHPGPPAPVR